MHVHVLNRAVARSIRCGRETPGMDSFMTSLSNAFKRIPLRHALITATIALALLQAFGSQPSAQCGNPIVCENAIGGNPASEWDVSGAGDASLQGFATDISVNKGDAVHFKVTTSAASF